LKFFSTSIIAEDKEKDSEIFCTVLSVRKVNQNSRGFEKQLLEEKKSKEAGEML